MTGTADEESFEFSFQSDQVGTITYSGIKGIGNILSVFGSLIFIAMLVWGGYGSNQRFQKGTI